MAQLEILGIVPKWLLGFPHLGTAALKQGSEEQKSRQATGWQVWEEKYLLKSATAAANTDIQEQ